ncbi:MAG: methyltransferase domain-containing protein [Caldilineaceae bacterium]|nr:methyltransferase domain-containing protein [Caldilineaceae bacterium]
MAETTHQGQIAGTYWEPTQYLKFSDHRLRPALELLDRIPLVAPQVIYDLGCGPGSVTRLLAERWPAATLYGLDNSPEMLAQAAAEPSTIQWLEADIRTWTPATPPALIYTNATLQWVDDHATLFPRLVSLVKPGGCIAIQMPLSWQAPSHRLMRETLANGGPNQTPLGTAAVHQAVARKWVAEAEYYYDLLVGCTQSLDIWETEYLQVLEGSDPVLEWVKGTGLRPILNGLEEQARALFLAEYTQRLRVAYPIRTDGRTLYPFRRLFMVATV